MVTKEQFDKMSEAEREYYYLRLLADTAPDKLRKKHLENYDRLNKLGQVEAVRRIAELTRLPQYTEPDPRRPSQGTPLPEGPPEGSQGGTKDE